MRVIDLLPLARRWCGPLASVRLSVTETPSGVTAVAVAQRSTSTGSGADVIFCAVGATEESALEDLHQQLTSHVPRLTEAL